MAVEITPAARDRIIRDLAGAGKPAPSWVAADPKLRAIYDQALPTPAGTIPPKKHGAKAAPKAGTPKPAAAPKPATAGKPSGTTGGSSKPARRKGGHRKSSGRAGTSSPRPAGPVPLPRALSRAAGGSAAGGLFLAIFLYPIALAIFKDGPAGFGTWLKAKFLNQTSGQPSAAPPPTDGGGPLGKIQGGLVAPNDPAIAGHTGTTPSVFNDSWARMMKNREAIPQ